MLSQSSMDELYKFCSKTGLVRIQLLSHFQIISSYVADDRQIWLFTKLHHSIFLTQVNMDASFLQDEKVYILLWDQIIYFLVVESPLRFLYHILHFPVIEYCFSIAIQGVTHVNFSIS